MKDFKKKYKKFIDSVNLTDDDYNEIKRNIIFRSKHKFQFKLKYAVILFFVIFISVLGITYADKIIEHYTLVTNENLPIEESLGNTFYSNARLDKDYSKDLFIEDSYYTYEEIEEKLGQKLLKNKYYDSDLFIVNYVDIEEDMIAKAVFSIVNKDKTSTVRNDFSIIIKTKYFSGRSGLSIKGDFYYEEYYIQSLNTKAIIVKTGSPIIEFTYENIAYEIVYGEYVNFDDEKTVNKLYDFLESFTLNL